MQVLPARTTKSAASRQAPRSTGAQSSHKIKTDVAGTMAGAIATQLTREVEEQLYFKLLS
ncbi:MAG: hypothetical protein ACTJLK_02750 [Anaplasma sp.]